jgi:hypothetical protein
MRKYFYLHDCAQTVILQHQFATLQVNVKSRVWNEYCRTAHSERQTATTTAHESVFSNMSTILHNEAENEVRFTTFLLLLVTETGNEK